MGTTALVPTLLASVGVSAVLPVLPELALGLGATLAVAAFVAAALTTGQLVGSVLGGALVIRLGERRTMLVAAALGILGGLLGSMASSMALLLAASAVTGISVAALALARHAFVTLAVPGSQRGRVMSLLAGCSKLGQVLGPFVMVLLLGMGASTRSSFAVVAAVSLVTGLLVVRSGSFGEEPHVAHRADGVWRAARENRRSLVVVGSGAALLGMLRISRLVLIPLWGTAIGLSAGEAALLVGVASVVDATLFYVGGALMDRYGRLRVTVPALLGFAVAHAALAMEAVVSEGVLLLTLVALVMAVANAMTSGVIQALGSDLADPRRPAGYLGAWRLITEAGPAVTPVIIAGTAAVSLGFASLAMAGVALVAAIVLNRWAAPLLPAHGDELPAEGD